MRSVVGAASLIAAFAFGCAAPNGFSETGLDDADGGPAGEGGFDGGGDTAPDAACTPGSGGCSGNTFSRCGENGMSRTNEMPCPMACDPGLGCVACRPGTRRCDGNISSVCTADGTRWVAARDCTEWGATCGGAGFCDDACAAAEITRSNVGCEYWPAPLANGGLDSPMAFDFRVVVSNPNDMPAQVTVSQAGMMLRMETVAPGGLREISLPWINDAHRAAIGRRPFQSFTTSNAAYRLRSDRPVTVAQFNPFEYNVPGRNCNLIGPGCYSYSNDATILYPSHTLLGDYIGVSYVPLSSLSMPTGTSPIAVQIPGYLAIVGTAAAPTRVQIRPSVAVAADGGGRWAATPAGTMFSFVIARGEVAHVLPATPPQCVRGRPGYREGGQEAFCRETGSDLTGSRVTSDNPIEVFGGHACAYVPYDQDACDHMEVQLPPVQTWGRQFVSGVMTGAATGGRNLVRVVAAQDNTQVTIDPPQGGMSTAMLAATEWIEFTATSAFVVTGTRPILTAQYLLGGDSGAGTGRGDPSLTVLVPQEQWRDDYAFAAPSSYNATTNGQNYLLIVRPPGAALTLDGAAVNATWVTVGRFEVARMPIDGGYHRMRGAMRFGLISYGLGFATSYAYPTGLNLEQLVVPG